VIVFRSNLKELQFGSEGVKARGAGNNVEPPEFTGTYSVDSDCTVTDTWGPPINSTHVSMIVDGGRGYVILNNTSGSGDTISGEARKQGASRQ
jgi:hypothetical protein